MRLTLLLITACTLTAFAQTANLPADINPDSRARLPYLQRKNMDEASQKIFDVLPGRSPEGALGGPLAFAAYNPAVAKALTDAVAHAVATASRDAILIAGAVVIVGTLLSLLIPTVPLEARAASTDEQTVLTAVEPEAVIGAAAGS